MTRALFLVVALAALSPAVRAADLFGQAMHSSDYWSQHDGLNIMGIGLQFHPDPRLDLEVTANATGKHHGLSYDPKVYTEFRARWYFKRGLF